MDCGAAFLQSGFFVVRLRPYPGDKAGVRFGENMPFALSAPGFLRTHFSM